MEQNNLQHYLDNIFDGQLDRTLAHHCYREMTPLGPSNTHLPALLASEERLD